MYMYMLLNLWGALMSAYCTSIVVCYTPDCLLYTLQSITSQYQFSDDQRRKEFLDLLFAFLNLEGTLLCTMLIFLLWRANLY